MINLVMTWMKNPSCRTAVMSAILDVIAFEQATTLERANAFLFLSRYLAVEDVSSPVANQSCPPDIHSTADCAIDLTRLKVTASRLLLANSDIMLVKALFDILSRLIHIKKSFI